MKVDFFDFDLPQRCIAQSPVSPRDAARLLYLPPGGGPSDKKVQDLPDLLQDGDVMVFNNTKVIPARLTGHRQRAGGSQPGPVVEVTLHKNVSGSIWQAFARPGRKLAVEDRISFADDFGARVVEKTEGGEIVLDFGCPVPDLHDGLLKHGVMPLPPYIKRDADGDDEDAHAYQTVYARHEGAVAAPTAGLHFTEGLLAALDDRGIQRMFVTLHVGAGTFLPVKVADTDDHRMHAEWGQLSSETAATINEARARGSRIVAVGTTALRLLESAADSDGLVHPYCAETDIFITPGYNFRVVDTLMTNFHLPRSTLFMLVSAFAGKETIRSAYEYAIREGYRFYSYGDASLLETISHNNSVNKN